MNDSRRARRDAGPPAQRPKPTPPTVPIRLPSDARSDEARSAARQPARRLRRRRARRIDTTIVFIGPMAAGKTSLGKRVARELKIPFVDSDALIVRAHGPITELFATRGEAEFRRIEAAVIRAELQRPEPRVFALGGGAVLDAGTRELLAGFPVVLLVTTQEAVLRTANLSRRPLLRDDPNAWGRIFEERRPLYEAVADVTYRTDRVGKEQLAKQVADWARRTRKEQQ